MNQINSVNRRHHAVLNVTFASTRATAGSCLPSATTVIWHCTYLDSSLVYIGPLFELQRGLIFPVWSLPLQAQQSVSPFGSSNVLSKSKISALLQQRQLSFPYASDPVCGRGRAEGRRAGAQHNTSAAGKMRFRLEITVGILHERRGVKKKMQAGGSQPCDSRCGEE